MNANKLSQKKYRKNAITYTTKYCPEYSLDNMDKMILNGSSLVSYKALPW